MATYNWAGSAGGALPAEWVQAAGASVSTVLTGDGGVKRGGSGPHAQRLSNSTSDYARVVLRAFDAWPTNNKYPTLRCTDTYNGYIARISNSTDVNIRRRDTGDVALGVLTFPAASFSPNTTDHEMEFWCEDIGGTLHFHVRVDGVEGTGSVTDASPLPAGNPGFFSEWISEASGQFGEFSDEIAGAAIPTISSVTPSTIAAGSNPVIAGTNFEASQGTGTVKLSPTDDVADAAAVTQSITSWGDTSITLNGVGFPTGTSHNDTLYLFVTNDTGDSNAAGEAVPVSLQAVLPSITLYDIDGQTALPTPLTNVRWAWFDEFPDGSGAMTPVNSGTGLTITNGALSLTVNNSYLVSGEYGMLLLEEPVSGRRQAYRLQVV